MKNRIIGSIMLGSMLNLFGVHCGMAQTAQWQWAAQGKGAGHDHGYEIATDASGNAYICGRFQTPSCMFGAVNLLASTMYNGAFFIAKLDSNGQHIWAKTAQSNSGSEATGIATDGNGNSMIVGTYATTDTFSFGTVKLSPNMYDATFIAGYDAQGNVKWAKNLGKTNMFGGMHTLDVGMDQSGQGRVTSYFEDSTYLIKTDQMGNEIWRKKFTASSAFANTSFRKLAIDPSGNTFVVGTSFATSLTFDNITITNNSNGGLLLIVKVDPNGNVLWAKFDGAIPSFYEPSICTDASGNCFVAGSFLGTIAQFGGVTLNNASGVEDMFICKYDSLGTLQWAKRAGGLGADMAKNLACDATGNVYMTGFFRGVVTFDPVLVNGSSTPELFVAKYDNNTGSCLWVKKAGGDEVEMGQGVYADAFGGIWSVGEFSSDTCVFDNLQLPNTSLPPYTSEVSVGRIKTSQTTTGLLGESEASQLVNIYPNPGNGLYTIDASKLQSPIRGWKLMDALGARVMEAQVENRMDVFQLDLKHLPAGIYFLQLSHDGGKTYRQRIEKR
jgi:hypothetical protein